MKASVRSITCDRPAVPAVVLAALLIALTAPPPACGDGGFVQPFGKDVWEPSQKAIILYDSESRTEDLILQVDFEGETKDFGWIVPVPSLPTLDTAERRVFYDCALLTQPITRSRDSGWGCLNKDSDNIYPAGRDYADGDINIYEQQTVGIYQTLTLSAGDASLLADSLEAWGYLHDGNRERVVEALDFYIEKSWYFVAMKMDSAGTGGQYYGGYWYGPIDPIRLSFETSEVVYPLRISAISASDPSEVLLYVCAPHRMTFAGATTEYANRLDDSELDHIWSEYEYLGQILTEACYMTKLRKTFRVAEMTDDLFLERAPNDDEFRQIDYTGFPSTELLLLATVGFWAVRARRRSS